MNIYRISKIIISFSLSFIIIFSVISCKDTLELKPIDLLDEQDVFTSIERFESAVLGTYEGWYPEHGLLISSVMADECRIGVQNSGVSAIGQNLFRWSFSSEDDEILGPWENAYQVIDRVNRLLKGLELIPTNSEDEINKLNQLHGELLAVRAYQHFDLYRIYGLSTGYSEKSAAVPYMRESNIDSQPSNLSTELFFKYLWDDILKAETLISDKNQHRMGLHSVYGLHARAALYAEKYEDAILYATKVIEKYPLATRSQFPDIWKDQNNSEVIFKLKRTNVSSMLPGDVFYNINAERVLFAPAMKLMKLYDREKDVRYVSSIGVNYDLLDEGQIADIVIKYEGEEGAKNKNDIKIFRTGEMYLIRAEAYLYVNNKAKAVEDLNVLRASRIEDYKFETYQDFETIKKSIIEERFKELAYEGHRYFDLKRIGEAIQRDDQDASSPFLELPTDSKYFFIPIPHAEILANPNIRNIQN